MKGKRLLLRFGAVDYACEVYVNGRSAGAHTGGYTPFALDITELVAEGENDLCVHTRSRVDCTQPRGKQNWKDHWFGCWYTPTSGIWQSVYLEAAGSPYLLSAHVTPDIDAGTASLRLTLNEAPVQPVSAKVTVSIEGKVFRAQAQTLTERSQRVLIDMVDGGDIQGFRKWSPDDPALYDVHIELDSGDDVTTYFGMRSVEVKDGYVLLNKQPLYQRLVLDQGYWPESLLTPPSDEAIRADIEWTKRFGYNGARKHQKVEDPRYYYWADKMGLLVWGEIPSAYELRTSPSRTCRIRWPASSTAISTIRASSPGCRSTRAGASTASTATSGCRRARTCCMLRRRRSTARGWCPPTTAGRCPRRTSSACTTTPHGRRAGEAL